jgi:hypothetical protein
MPYASGMLQAANKQLYTTDAAGKITGYQPYKPFSTNANDYVAGFTPLQQQAQQGAANLQMPGQFGQATNLAQQAGNYSQLAQDPNAVGNYMSPYMQNVVDRQKMEANRDFDISGAQQMGQATGAGAFGGSRDAIMAAENERNRQWKLSDIQQAGTQNAFQNAQQSMQFGNNAQLASAQALGQLGEAQQNTNLNMLNAQNTFGGQQQQQQQQAINQAVLNYQNEINQPYVAAGTMSDLIRGTPMNNMTTMNYQAQPSFGVQAGGALGSAASLYGAYKTGQRNKNGGIIQSYAEGGVTDESSVSSYLDNLTPTQLRQLRQKSQSVENNKIIDEVIARKEGAVQTAKNGGILGYADEKDKKSGSLTNSKDSLYEDYKNKKIPYEEYKKKVGLVGVLDQAVSNTAKGLSPKHIDSIVQDKLINPVVNNIGWYGEEINKPEPTTPAPTTPAPTTPAPAVTEVKNTDSADPRTVNRGIATQPTATPTQPTSGGINTGADQQLNNAIADAQTNAGMTAPVVSNADEKGVSKEDYDKSVTEEKRLTGMSTEDIMHERNAEMERLGIKSPDQLNAEERKRIGEERVNAQDEQKRQVYLRMAEFFSNWGSTPGAPLAAGLKAMKETLPGVMDDSKAHHKLMMDLNKSESDLNRAVELEKAGRFDKASALKDAASKRLQDHEESWMVLSMKKQIEDKKLAAEEKIAAATNASQERRTNVMAGTQSNSNAILPNGMSNKEATLRERADDNARADLKDDPNYIAAIPEVKKQMRMDASTRALRALGLKYIGGDDADSSQIQKTKSGTPYSIMSK